MSKQKLYIVTFYNDASEVDRDVEWFWATSEKEAKKLFKEYINEINIGETEIIDIYEVEVPQEVLNSYMENKQ